jgi:hypothetical protein
MMDYAIIATIVTLVLTLAASVFGAKYSQGKGKLAKIAGLLDDVVVAAQDDQVTEAEFQKIVADAKAVREAS